MRITAAQILGKNSPPTQEKPREGSRLREIYDRAMTGKWFIIADLTKGKNISNTLAQLTIGYELEFESKRGYRSPSKYRCIGKWDGADFKSITEVQEAIEFTKQEK